MNQQLDVDDLICIAEAAELRGVSYRAIQDLLKRKKLSVYKIGRRRLLSRKEIENLQPEPIGRPAK